MSLPFMGPLGHAPGLIMVPTAGLRRRRDNHNENVAPLHTYSVTRVLCDTKDMTDLDLAKLKRLRAAVSNTLACVPEKSAHGLPPTYNTLRTQVISAVPAGLRSEVESLAPEVKGSARGPQGVIEKAQDGANAYARLAALKGWLDAVIESV